jgi:hypothetical protein
MSNQRQYLMWMAGYLAMVAVICALLYDPLKSAFMANWGFNALILCMLAAGVVINLYQVIRLEPEIRWMHAYRTGTPGLSVVIPSLLSPLAKHLSGLHRDRFSLSAPSMRTVLEGIRGRLDESREVSRYMIGLLIFLGLLGTFWGLLGTISAVSNVISGLRVSGGDFASVFETLKAGLQEPLGGMGTAFSSSIFGLGGALVLGFLDIQAGHAQNRFFNELEEWLLGVTHLVEAAPGEKIVARALGKESGFEAPLLALIAQLRESALAMEGLLKKPSTDSNPSKKSEEAE